MPQGEAKASERPRKGVSKFKLLVVFGSLLVVPASKMHPGPFGGPQTSPKPPGASKWYKFQTISAFEAATKTYIRFA